MGLVGQLEFSISILFIAFRRLVVHAGDTTYTEENIKEALEPTWNHLLNPCRVLGQQKPVIHKIPLARMLA